MKLNDLIKFRCNNCGTDMESDMDFECSCSDDERGMGYEYQHEGVLETECCHCGNRIRIQIVVSEYPVGAFNDLSIVKEGADLLEEPDITMLEEDDF